MEQPQIQQYRQVTPVSDKSRTVTLILCVFLGIIGIHRFYIGKTVSGIIYLFTLGIFGLGWLFDLLVILLGNMKDNTGHVIKNW